MAKSVCVCFLELSLLRDVIVVWFIISVAVVIT